MKKSLVIFTLVTGFATGLVGCSSEPVPVDPNALPDGIMQPVDGTGAMDGGSFMPEIEQSSMPENMK